jgi:poly(3-hydroxyalkanoate) synthetase
MEGRAAVEHASIVSNGEPWAGGGAGPQDAAGPAPRIHANPFLWPLIAAATASDAAAGYFHDLAHAVIGEPAPQDEPELAWASPNRIALELTTVRLRDFSTGSDGTPTLICAPFALHGATIADFAPGHSLVEALRAGGRQRVLVTDWRSARPDMRFLSIDSYLADLNVLVDAIGAPVDLVGLCQGGWMALVYAARFPGKVRRLVLAGAPVDISAGASAISQMAQQVPLSTFAELVRLGGGRVLGSRVLELWGPVLAAEESARVLQLGPHADPARSHRLQARFREWYDWTVDLPGTYYLQVVSWLFRENRIAEGRFVALGRTIDLASIDIPAFLIAGRNDTLVAAEQLLAIARLIGTPRHAVETVVEPCSHLSLFIGRETLARVWPGVADWLGRDLADRAVPHASR